MNQDQSRERKYYAHTPPPESMDQEWQLLKDHLSGVAELARQFANDVLPDDSFLGNAAYLAGWLHDFGKYRDPFQEYLAGLRTKNSETQHAIYGAALACKLYHSLECMAVIAGHHGGLSDFQGELAGKVKKVKDDEIHTIHERFMHDTGTLDLPKCTQSSLEFIQTEFMIRMLFSCLVDADWLNTADYMKIKPPISPRFEPNHLLVSLDQHIEKLSKEQESTALNSLRMSILLQSEMEFSFV